MEEGKRLGRRPELVGGGLVRSLGGWSKVLSLRSRGEEVAYDSRILGSGEFVQDVMRDAEETIARQMRAVIRQQLQAGKSKQQVIQYFVDRYGDQIIWSPPWQGFFLIAWLVPIALLLAGAVLLFFILRNWRAATPLDATTEEQELSDIDEAELERYRAQLEQEFAADDPIFRQPRTEVP